MLGSTKKTMSSVAAASTIKATRPVLFFIINSLSAPVSRETPAKLLSIPGTQHKVPGAFRSAGPSFFRHYP